MLILVVILVVLIIILVVILLIVVLLIATVLLITIFLHCIHPTFKISICKCRSSIQKGALSMPENFSFFERLQSLLGPDYPAFAAAAQAAPFRGLRVNTLKSSPEQLRQFIGFSQEPTPFCSEGFYIDAAAQGLGNHPLHHAGAFYMQEPSAQSAVTALGVQPGDRVLDLCAAPGGKSTQIAQKIGDTGLLWANEKVFSRAKILLSNLERLGVKNMVVSSLDTQVLCPALPGFFDKVLVDAPCSGEGMFRRDETILRDWNVKNILACADRQKHILNQAAQAVKPGGVLVYSTCTYAVEENEEVLRAFLAEHPEFCLEEIPVPFGRPAFGADMQSARRILPMDGGEGHFVARLRKTAGDMGAPVVQKNQNIPLFTAFWQAHFAGEPPYGAVQKGDAVFLMPPLPEVGKLPLVRTGLYAGNIQKGRFVPEHALFAAAGLTPKQVVDLSADSKEIKQFLHGEEIDCPDHFTGYTAVRVEGIPLGFGKASGGRLKNHYPKGLRTLY